MRRIIVSVLLIHFFCPIQVSAQKDAQPKGSSTLAKNEFLITGKIMGRDTGNLVLLYYDKTGKFVKDTTVLNQGAFKFKGFISEPTPAQLIGNLKATSMSDPNRTAVFLEPGSMQLELIEGSFFKAKLSGSKTQTEFDAFHQTGERCRLISDSLKIERAEILETIKNQEKSAETDKRFSNLNAKYTALNKERDKVAIDFFTTHPDSYVSPLLMWDADDKDQLTYKLIKSSYHKLSDGPKNSLYGKLIEKKIKAKEGVVVGNVLPGLVAKDMNGKVFSLEQFQDKNYVLLDFWHEACAPCRVQSKQLKKLYALYHTKGLEIISISWDNDERIWKKAVKEDGIGAWYNMMMKDADVSNGEASVTTRFNIQVYPTIILIDKKGIILYRNDGIDEKGLDDVLASLKL